MIGFTSMLHALVAITLVPATLSASLRSLAAMEYQSVMAGDLNCVIENGFDFVGYDISNAPGPVESCCDLCSAVNNCVAWSWSSGTCYFKSARGPVVANAGVKSALFFRGPVGQCELDQDIDYVGNDIGSSFSARAEGCCSLCQKYQGCRAYSWNNDNGGTCYFKSAAGERISKAGVKSAVAYPGSALDCPTQQQDVDYVGNDVGNKPSANPGDCCSLCKGTPNCNAYSWSSGTCYLKSAKTFTVGKTGVISAELLVTTYPKCNWERGIDYIGNDIGKGLGPVESCCGKCANFLGCRAYSWNAEAGGTCYFKSAKGQTVNNAAVISSVLYF